MRKFTRYSVEGIVVDQLQKEWQRLSKSSRIRCTKFSRHQKPNKLPLKERDMPVAFNVNLSCCLAWSLKQKPKFVFQSPNICLYKHKTTGDDDSKKQLRKDTGPPKLQLRCAQGRDNIYIFIYKQVRFPDRGASLAEGAAGDLHTNKPAHRDRQRYVYVYIYIYR